MTKQKAPYFPFYYRDWLHGTRRLTAEEKVQYLEMLCEQADQPTGSIPEDIFNSECKSERVREKFDQDSNGFFNVRQRDVILSARNYRESRLKNLQGKSKPHKGDHMEPHMEIENENEIEKGKRKVKKTMVTVPAKSETTEPIVYPFTDEVFLNRWEAWKRYKKEEHKFNYKSQATEQAALKQLGEMARGNMGVALAIIQQSMSNGWKGFFELKGGSNEPRTQAEAEDYMARVRKTMNK